jgi:hypothetical protein
MAPDPTFALSGSLLTSTCICCFWIVVTFQALKTSPIDILITVPCHFNDVSNNFLPLIFLQYMFDFFYRSLSILFIYHSLIVYGFTSRSRIFHLYGDVAIAGEGQQNLSLCSALRAFEQRGIFIVPHQLWHGTSVFSVSSEWPPPFSRL